MKHLTNLFKLMQLTRSQPLYGYVIGGVQKNDLSNLAEHHYLVTFIDSLVPVLKLKISRIKDPIAKKELNKFTKDWLKNISKKEIPEILYNIKDK